jgi:hypothetical protein
MGQTAKFCTRRKRNSATFFQKGIRPLMEKVAAAPNLIKPAKGGVTAMVEYHIFK